ncbi:MAG: hypothetical protein QXU82_03100 [Candidatus Aenigmatarchaeota archaeon]
MLPHWHLLLGLAFFLPLRFLGVLTPFGAAFALAASVLIDADHMIVFGLRLRTASPKKVWCHCRELGKSHGAKGLKMWFLMPFHNPLFCALAYFIYYPLFIGVLFHVVCDALYALIFCVPKMKFT